MPGRSLAVLLLVSLTQAYPFLPVDGPSLERRQAGARTNDVICSMNDYKGDAQFPPPVVITYPDGSTSCGCASDIVQGGNGSYTQCNEVYPVFGTDGYNDSGLRQNACVLNDQYVAVCATSCTPNTTPNGDGTCRPYNSDSYTLQSPTTQYGSETAAPVATPTTSSTDQYTDPSSQDWNPSSQDWDSWTSEAWSESQYSPSQEFYSASTSDVISILSTTSSIPAASLAPVSESASVSSQSSAATRLSLGACSFILFAGLCL